MLTLGIGVVELGHTIRFADLFYLQSDAVVPQGMAAPILSEYARVSEQVYAEGFCRSDIVDAGLDIVLADLDVQNADRDFDAWLTSIKRAQKYLRHALECAPSVSNYWTRLAMVQLAGGENPQELAFILSKAVALDPANIGALRSRFVVWRSLSKDGLLAAKPSFERDLLVLLTHGGPNQVRSILSESSKEMDDYIADAVNHLPDDRRSRLQRWRVLPNLKADAVGGSV